jgi:hypothetical protein
MMPDVAAEDLQEDNFSNCVEHVYRGLVVIDITCQADVPTAAHCDGDSDE